MYNRDLSGKQAWGCHQPRGKPRRLLIVDDDPRLCRILSRRLESSFDALHAASTLKEANRRLNTEAITHLICDHHLGEGVPKGTDLVARWRQKHRSIERAVLFTDEQPYDITAPTGLDAIVYKTTDFYALMNALGLWERAP